VDDFEKIADAKALEAIRKSEGFYALVRLMRRKKDDLFAEWASNKELTRDFCNGVLSVVQTFEDNVDQEIANGRRLEEEGREQEKITRGRALEGGGTGDLA
jgi:hypothetical protein